MSVKNILIQKVNDENWCAFLYQRPQELLATAPTLEELVKRLPASTQSTVASNQLPQVGELYYRVGVSHDLELGVDIRIREERFTQSQADYVKQHGKCPPNVFQTASQARAMGQRITQLFNDYCRKWE